MLSRFAAVGGGRRRGLRLGHQRTRPRPRPGLGFSPTSTATLYRYDPETGTGTVVCLGPCTDTRKPLLTEPGAVLALPPGIGALSTVARPHGSGDQVTYDGSPLYTFTGDAQPAETNGVTRNWHVITGRGVPGQGRQTCRRGKSAPEQVGGEQTAPPPRGTSRSYSLRATRCHEPWARARYSASKCC
ncbi:hypothetical protein [Streptomyces sp. NPDC002088]|uniref:COG4315 family predicted lipoprotein n=1 Tax=Streptomyces sp. NPDC002088 TaxID=3154665 RepID=UPI003330A325